jgi:hypothetical protein
LPPDPGPLAERVRRLLGRLLAKDPAERPQDARAVVEDLQKVAEQHATLAALMTTSASLEQARRELEAEAATKAAADSAWRTLVEQAHSDLGASAPCCVRPGC